MEVGPPAKSRSSPQARASSRLTQRRVRASPDHSPMRAFTGRTHRVHRRRLWSRPRPVTGRKGQPSTDDWGRALRPGSPDGVTVPPSVSGHTEYCLPGMLTQAPDFFPGPHHGGSMCCLWGSSPTAGQLVQQDPKPLPKVTRMCPPHPCPKQGESIG